MDLKLYDTLSREKRSFVPIDPANVRMYVCGPTVYDFAHIGNARPVIVFDVLFRMLRHLYGAEHVTYVRNITDVDDKINARAAEEYPALPLNEAIRKVTEKTDKQFHDDVAALGCLPPSVEPRATEHIAEMRTLIEKLIASGNAYVAEDNVLFSVPSMKDYGQLSKRPLDEMIAGARVEVAPYKKDARDFVLWKPSKPGEPSWPSPAGVKAPGRPGWHIECSAMSWKYLGETFDIHGGGIDLVFPHHEDEIAQSRCAFHTPVMANYWIHNGFLQIEGEKMSKSLGNFVTIREILQAHWHGRAWSGNVVRLAMLTTHYRQPIDWSARRLAEVEKELFAIAGEFLQIPTSIFKNDHKSFADWLETVREPLDPTFIEFLCDDLNMPGALSAIRPKFPKISSDLKVASSVLATLQFVGVLHRQNLFLNTSPILRGVLDKEAQQGVFLAGRRLQVAMLNGYDREINEARSLLTDMEIEATFQAGGITLLSRDADTVSAQKEWIEKRIKARWDARARKDWAESDRIRDELLAMGIVLKDSKEGTTWEIAR
ncbi:MAG TPA: cysteine--tRNA ligase [Xanthobacteraceae bacterium]|jgi:cysteinyl-tRNA synthetase|nr:cysteine--tRNA ligase [Xanthobacteraceae bacterium]